MSRRDISEADLHAYVDDELERPRRTDVEAHVETQPEDAARVAAYAHLNDVLRARYDDILEQPVPARLTRPPARRAPKVLRYAAALGWLTLGGLAGWQLHAWQVRDDQASTPAWARRAAVAHIVYSPEVRHPVEVGADQEDHLVAWLSKRLGTPLRIPNLNGIGYGLVGGRLLPGERGPAAQFMYEDGQGQRLTLYVRANREQSRETAFRFAQDGPVRVFYWVDRGLGFALSAELEKEDLLRVANALYQQLNP